MEIQKFETAVLEKNDMTVSIVYDETGCFTHRHDFYEIQLYDYCLGDYVLNGITHKISDSCLFLLTPKDFCRINTERKKGSSRIIISFAEHLIDGKLLPLIAFIPRIWKYPSEHCVGIMKTMLARFRENDPLCTHELNLLLNALLCEILKNGERAQGETNAISPAISRIMTTLLSDISAKITLTDAARISGMNPTYFSERFHSEVGKSFKQWVTSARIEYAKRLLEEFDQSILEVCYKCGYNTPSQFIEMFKRETGMAPSEYKKKNS